MRASILFDGLSLHAGLPLLKTPRDDGIVVVMARRLAMAPVNREAFDDRSIIRSSVLPDFSRTLASVLENQEDERPGVRVSAVDYDGSNGPLERG
jgi:hypothetical protein